MERTINFVIKGALSPGEILSEMGTNKAGEPSIIFYSQQKPSGWFKKLQLELNKLFGIVRSGTAVATKYSNELSSAVPGGVKDIKEKKTCLSFSTPQALQIYLNSIKDGSYTLSDNGVSTKVNVEIETEPLLDDAYGKKPWNDNDRKIFQSLKSPNSASKYSPYQSSRPLSDDR